MHEEMSVQHKLLESADIMLAPETMGDILKRKVSHVSRQPFDSPYGYSGNRMYYIMADDERLVMKRLLPRLDWVALATDDHLCRSVTVWQYGLLDRILPYLDHATLASCQDGDDYAVLMRDVSDGLIYEREITQSEMRKLLNALAGMHAIFWEDENLKKPELGLCNLEKLVKYALPTMFDQYPHDKRTLERLSRGWEALLSMLEPTVSNAVQALIANPQPLFASLATYPPTFLHADYKTSNLAFMPNSGEVIAFDWQCATYALMTIDLAWFLMSSNVCGASSSIRNVAEYYRLQLVGHLGHRFDQERWRAMLDLGFLVDLLRKGCWHALYAVTKDDEDVRTIMRTSVALYNDLVRESFEWL